ncbi:adenylosuccinate lyase [candidate division WOR-3 bacterium]|nr:adenylosuccinate lyase [candidate division WOR-3 bacterium]
MIRRYATAEMAVLWSEEAKFNSWLLVEKTVARVQGGLGIIPRPAASAIQRASFRLAEIERFERETNHDVIAFTRSVARSIGRLGRYVHHGLTSYDVVDTALSLRCQSALDLIELSLRELHVGCARLALKYKRTPMIGRTHGVHAEPVTFGLKCLTWYSEVGRCIAGVQAARAQVGYGKLSGAVGSYTQLPVRVEELVLRRLGLKPEPASTQVIPRDRHALMLCHLALVATSLERIATEIRNLQRTEIGEVGEPFARGQRGSSAMPHKRNPIVCERVVSLARVIRGYAVVGMENVPLWHERDLTNSASERIAIPESCTYLHYVVRKLTAVLSGLVVDTDRMRRNLELTSGVYFSQSLMLALVRAGMARDVAYRLVQELAFESGASGRPLPELARGSRQVTRRLSERDLRRVFDIRRLLGQVDRVYRRCGLARHGRQSTIVNRRS